VVKNPPSVKSNHHQQRENRNGNAPDLPKNIAHSGKAWGVSRELKRTAKGTDSTKTRSWNS